MSNEMRERITRGAHRFFFEHGYGETQMDELAAAIGVAKKTIYNHFPSKQHLMREVLSYDTLLWLDQAEKIFADASTGFAGRLKALFSHAIDTLRKRASLFPEPKEVHAGYDSLREQNGVTFRNGVVSILKRILDPAIAMGLVRADVDSELVAYSILNMLQGLARFSALPDVPYAADELLAGSVHLIRTGLLTEEGLKLLAMAQASQPDRAPDSEKSSGGST